MKTRMLSEKEKTIAAYNLREIDREYRKLSGGKPMPSGYIEASDYSSNILSSGDSYLLAHNIMEIERRSSINSSSTRDYKRGSDSHVIVPAALFTVFFLIGWIIAHLVVGG